MTEEELVERIADRPLRRHQIAATTGTAHCCACDLTWRDGAQYRHHLAQAVIDDLGLTVETGGDAPSPYGDGPITLAGMSRVVGKWMEEEA